MLMPSIFGENLFDDWMDFPFDRNFFEGRDPLYGKHAKNIMKTDVRETDDTYYNRPMLTKTMLASLTAEQIAVEAQDSLEIMTKMCIRDSSIRLPSWR